MKAGVCGRRDWFVGVIVWVVLIAAEGPRGIARARWSGAVVRTLWPRRLSEYDVAHDAWLALGAAAPALSPVLSAKA